MSTTPGLQNPPCYYCQLDHREVEGSGFIYCPSPLCPGPGAYVFRHRLPSFSEDKKNNKHTFEEAELIAAGLARAEEVETTDPALAAATRASVSFLEPNFATSEDLAARKEARF
jgi:hypothetical protein